MSTLPILRVRTNHSEYLIDQENQKFSRKVVHDHANPIMGHSDGEWHDYQEIYSGLDIGQSLIIIKPTGEWIRSTLVQAVAELEQEAA